MSEESKPKAADASASKSEESKLKEAAPVSNTEQTFAQRMNNMTLKEQELRNKISEFRKVGKDMYFSQLTIANLHSKIHYAEITREPKDMDAVDKILEDAKKEIEEEGNAVEKTFMDEVNDMLAAESANVKAKDTKSGEVTKDIKKEVKA